ncbi:MAG: glycosyltransferase, partial [Actinobacteria bacterium]
MGAPGGRRGLDHACDRRTHGRRGGRPAAEPVQPAHLRLPWRAGVDPRAGPARRRRDLHAAVPQHGHRVLRGRPAVAPDRPRHPRPAQARPRVRAGQLPGQARLPPAGAQDARAAARPGPPADHDLPPPADPRLGVLALTTDPRLLPPAWNAASPGRRHRLRLRLCVALCLPLALFYFAWLLDPTRIGNPVLYMLLVAAELFNLAQAVGFWWTCTGERSRPPLGLAGEHPDVDVLVPVYDEPVDVVEPTIAAARRMRGARVHVWLLDDGARDEMRAMASRQGAGYLRRKHRSGAKAGNINHALRRTRSRIVVVLDCDHVPQQRFLQATLGHLAGPDVAFVQTPQCYANAGTGELAAAAWSQHALFFGAIARGKDGHDAMFCCGTNVVFRREALEDVGGFPEGSVTEDFELSIKLHERGWRSAYVPEVLALGLGPEDMASYVGQQHRWARGCLGAMGAVMRARLPLRVRLQYLLSCSYFLTGWTVLAYMTFPVVRILTGQQPLAAPAADQFLLHFAPYFGMALSMVAMMGAGAYTFRAFALQSAS